MSRSMVAFLAGLGGGYLKAKDKARDDERQAKQDQWQTDQQDRQRKDWEEKDRINADLKDASAERTSVQGTVLTEAGGNKLLMKDPQQAASMQQTLAAEAEMKGEAAPTTQAGGAVTGNLATGSQISTGAAPDVAALNTPDARNERIAGALRKNGQVERAASMESTMLDQSAKRLGLDMAQAKFADDQFNRRLNERLSSGADWTQGAAEILDATEIGPMAGVSVAARKSADGKTVEFVGTKADGTSRVLTSFENTDAGKAKFLQTVARVPLESKIGWIVEDSKAAKEEQRWQQTFDFNKKKEENDQDYRNRVLSIQMAQEGRARATHNAAMKESTAMPPGVKMAAQSLNDQLKTINTALSKSMAEGLFDPNNPGTAALIKDQRIVGLKYQALIAPYIPGAGQAADPLGMNAAPGQPAPAPGQPVAAVPAARAVPTPMQDVTRPPAVAAPVAAPARPPATVTEIIAGPSSSPALLASAQARAQSIEVLASQIKAAQASVAQTARTNPQAVGPAMQQVAAARAELNKALTGMNGQQAAQVLAAVGLQ